jgi:DNA polymerase III subunit gamma/tau
MSYLAIARKWRPSRFEDLVGQGHVVQTLKNAILFHRVSHAYLFCGARGIGKTSVARIFAKALRCPNAKDAVPCNQCEECQLISESRSVDVVEIDGASNNGVEAVRGIRDNVAYGSATGHYKIYIIDEVHMLSISAFNALLKTLEEPPPHVIFVMATTEMQKIPLTILSRCQRFEFRRLTHHQVVERLQFILGEEKIQIEETGLRTIASQADGSLRDALSLLDQVLSFFGGEVRSTVLTNKQVVESLGVADNNAISQFWEYLLKKDTTSVLKLIADTYMAGVDLKHFGERCLEELRLLYLIALAKDSGEELSCEQLDISPVHFTNLRAAADLGSLVQLERMAQILSKSIQQLSWSTLPRFVLEMAAVRMTKLDTLQKIEEALLKGGNPPGSVIARSEATKQSPNTTEGSPNVIASAAKQSRGPTEGPQLRSVPTPPPVEMSAADVSWRGFVDFAMKKRPLLGALLSHGNFKIEGEKDSKRVTLAFPSGTFYERQAGDQKEVILEFAKIFFGKETAFILSNEVATTSQSLEAEKTAEVNAIKKAALEHPAVSQMKELLGAEVVGVHVDS